MSGLPPEHESIILDSSCRNYRLSSESLHSSIAQSVERMTVNHDVTGSSPVRGANKKDLNSGVFFNSTLLPEINLGSKK